MRIVHSGAVDLFAIGCRSDGTGRYDGVDAAVTGGGTVATSRSPPTRYPAGTTRVVLETGIGVRESTGT